MSLLLPETGLLFWMLLSFSIVFFILAKFGFPVISRVLAERKEFIETSLASAREANLQLSQIKAQAEEILSKAREERTSIIEGAMQSKKEIVEQAKQAAIAEGVAQMQRAAVDIEAAKQRAIREIRSEIAGISISMTEKIVRERLSDSDQQMGMINRMLDEMSAQKS